MADEEKKRGKFGKLSILLAVLGTIFFMKKRRGSEDAGWEEATPGT